MNPFFLTQRRKGAKFNFPGVFASWREALA
jgi:hypothetical protein